jgi:hypothetical protein
MATGLAWLVVAAATARLLFPSNRLLTAGLGGFVAAGAVVAACLGVALLAAIHPSRRALSVSFGVAVLTVSVAVLLNLVRAAHETAAVIAAAGLAAGGLSIIQLRHGSR